VGGRFSSVETRVAEGDARREIVRAADEWKADLVMLGARGLGAVASVLLGSVSVGVTRHAHCPVLVVKARATRARRIVIAMDGSQDALAAAHFIAQLPLEPSAVIRLLGVVEPPQFPVVGPYGLASDVWTMKDALVEERRHGMEAVLERAKRIFAARIRNVETSVIVGQVAHEIVSAASEANVDLVVVGARGLGGFERLVLGSVSDNVVRHAPCSVLVVKHRRD
jgi:nucleotide-binding universal stress UspA family protein